MLADFAIHPDTAMQALLWSAVIGALALLAYLGRD